MRNGPRRLGFESLENRQVLSAGSISGSVFVDANGNGELDVQEVGISDVTIRLQGIETATRRVISIDTTTDAHGLYLFDNVNPGIYWSYQVQPTGYLDGNEQLGTGEKSFIYHDKFYSQLLDGEHVTGNNFGELEPGELRGYAYVDMDRDGNFDFGDHPIRQVHIQLQGIDDRGNAVRKSVRTLEDGSYSFDSLRPGTYEILAEQTDGFTDGRETIGSLTGRSDSVERNGTASNDRFSGIQLRSGETGYSYNFGEFDDAHVPGTLATDFPKTIEFDGTLADDMFEFIAGTSQHTVILNGESFTIDASVNTLIRFSGRGGNDHVLLVGSPSKDEVEMRGNSTKLTGISYQVQVFTTPQVVAQGGGGEDRAMFYDTAGDETFEASPIEARLSGNGFELSAQDFHRVYAYATAGHDRVILHDSSGDDAYKATPTDARLYGTGFFNYARGFDETIADASAGGTDRAYLYDSPGADTFVANAYESRLHGPGFDNTAQGFDRVYGFSSDTNDVAHFHDTLASDFFRVDQNDARMFGDGYYNRAIGFSSNFAYFTGPSIDEVFVQCSSGRDSVQAKGDSATVIRADRSYVFQGMERMTLRRGLGTVVTDIESVDFVLKMEGDGATS